VRCAPGGRPRWRPPGGCARHGRNRDTHVVIVGNFASWRGTTKCSGLQAAEGWTCQPFLRQTGGLTLRGRAGGCGARAGNVAMGFPARTSRGGLQRPYLGLLRALHGAAPLGRASGMTRMSRFHGAAGACPSRDVAMAQAEAGLPCHEAIGTRLATGSAETRERWSAAFRKRPVRQVRTGRFFLACARSPPHVVRRCRATSPR
jgi:hypothetical protein